MFDIFTSFTLRREVKFNKDIPDWNLKDQKIPYTYFKLLEAVAKNKQLPHWKERIEALKEIITTMLNDLNNIDLVKKEGLSKYNFILSRIKEQEIETPELDKALLTAQGLVDKFQSLNNEDLIDLLRDHPAYQTHLINSAWTKIKWKGEYFPTTDSVKAFCNMATENHIDLTEFLNHDELTKKFGDDFKKELQKDYLSQQPRIPKASETFRPKF